MDGEAKISLVDSEGKEVLVKTVQTEEENTYNISLRLMKGLPAGKYTVRYNDGKINRTPGVYEMKQPSLKAIPVQELEHSDD